MKLFKTGIAGLDEFLQEGLPPGVFLLMGQIGSGIEVFARKVAYLRAEDTGVTYFTFSRTPEVVKDDMSLFGWDISKLEESGDWRFINLSENDSVEKIIIGEMVQKRCVVVDSFSELLLNQKMEEAINLLISMSALNRDLEELHFLILIEGMQDQKVDAAMQYFADGVIAFTTNWGNDVISRNILIKKMRRKIVPSRSLPYSIGEEGFVIETAIRIT